MPQPNEIKALRTFIATASDGPLLLIWIAAKPRITTFRPIARSLHAAGYRVAVGYAADMGATAADIGLGGDLPAFRIANNTHLATLEGVAVFITSEQDVKFGPENTIRFAVHHSLPDYDITRDYARIISHKPIAAAEADYYAILVTQTAEQWRSEPYLPHVDNYLPEAMLRHRRPSLTMVPFGYPKIDALMAEDTDHIARDTITYAPTQSTIGFGSVRQAGGDIIALLLRDFPDHRIAFRPYPGKDPDRIKDVYAPFMDHDRFELDLSLTGEDTLRRSALVVTDRSSMAVSFGLGYARPVVFFSYRGLSGKRSNGMQRVEPIGYRVGTLPKLTEAVRLVLDTADDIAADVIARRSDFIHNPGRSVDYLVDIMPDIIANRTRDDWLVIPRRPFRAATQAENIEQARRIERKVRGLNPQVGGAVFEQIETAFRESTFGWVIARLRRIARKIPGLRRYLFPPSDRA